ncbi:aldehyde dehydrogenase (NADP(+)) (plasmid) [Deinococcus radiomollis]|uniref:aldehyde dehydrogenase (NADP(+)) n=1 Tax=Deinococcus radiomollis TaxID=468916 RepID=UPI0038915EF1
MPARWPPGRGNISAVSLPEQSQTQPPQDHRSFQAVHPVSGEPFGPAFALTPPAEIEALVLAAAKAAPEYAGVSGQRRGAFLRQIAAQIEALATEIVAAAMSETGLSEVRLRGEVGRTANQLRLFAGIAEEGSWVDARLDRPDAARKPAPKPDLRSLLVPLGVVAVFGASNFPLAFSVAGGDTASALAAGCPVVVKAHPAHPATSALVGEAVQIAARECGLPAGVFALVFDDGFEAGLTLVQHPAVRAVGFTGSRSGGLALIKAAQERAVPIPVYAEMSSINPVVFTEAALKRTDVAQLAASISGSGGQLCTQPGLLFVPEGETGDRFVAALGQALSGVAACALLTPGIQAAYRSGTAAYAGHVAVTTVQGQETENGLYHAQLYQTTLEAFGAAPELAHEVFGPVSLVVRYDDQDCLSTVLGRLEGQLTATLHADPGELPGLERVTAALRERAGRLVFNGFPTGVEVGHAVVHGGPFPATGDGRSTSVGSRALLRFSRLLAYQDFPDEALPPALQSGNPLGLLRIQDGEATRDPL